jgi:hypothetical protein
MPGDHGSSIAPITGIKEEMTGWITDMACPNWRPWKKSKQAPAVASVQGMRAINSLSSNSSHRCSKCSRGRKIMSRLTRMPVLARRSSGRSIQLV